MSDFEKPRGRGADAMKSAVERASDRWGVKDPVPEAPATAKSPEKAPEQPSADVPSAGGAVGRRAIEQQGLLGHDGDGSSDTFHFRDDFADK